jgi:2,3-bisphosphoglycerate-independent phosphoglycerate mutase
VTADPNEIRQLFDSLEGFECDGVALKLHPTNGMFSVLTMRGDVAPHITDTNPMVDGRLIPKVLPLAPYADDPPTRRTARILTEYLKWAHRRLTDAPLNRARRASGDIPVHGLVTQRAGRLKPCLPMRTRYGLRGLSIASGTIYAGLARFTGMDFIMVPDTDDPGADLAQRISLAREKADDYDFIHVHTKAPDQAAHSKAPDAKVRVVESIDRGLARSLEPLLEDENVLLAVTADHSTPSCGKLVHSGEPVPLMFIGTGVRRDAVKTFDEISVAGGCLGAMRGRELLFSILNYLDRARLVGIHDSPAPVEYWPSDHEPFILDPKPQE